MISEYDVERIRDDARIARDALNGLIQAPVLTEHYVKEKLNTIRACIKFIENFEGKTKK